MSNSAKILESAKAAQVAMKPLFVRVPEAEILVGIKRSKLLLLAKKGLISSASVCDPGASKGVRLFEVASLESYVRSFFPKEGGES